MRKDVCFSSCSTHRSGTWAAWCAWEQCMPRCLFPTAIAANTGLNCESTMPVQTANIHKWSSPRMLRSSVLACEILQSTSLVSGGRLGWTMFDLGALLHSTCRRRRVEICTRYDSVCCIALAVTHSPCCQQQLAFIDATITCLLTIDGMH